MSDILQKDTVSLCEETCSLVLIDQTLLPGETRMLSLCDAESIREAIYMLRVRGAPAIGVAAAIGLYVCAARFTEKSREAFLSGLRETADYLSAARPTAVNLSWALKRMVRKAEESAGEAEDLIRILHDEALLIRDEDIDMCYRIGVNALTLLHDGDGILTHCNAGQLATTRFGTALAPIHVGRQRGMNFRVYCDETRPLLQGIRLSAYEMAEDGVDTTVLCDNMASQAMKNGWIDAVIVGSDRVAANGDCCNKIGTSGVAILAAYYGIPFYVCVPTSTIDMTRASGDEIEIEQRPAYEVTELWYQKRMAPQGVKVFNPAFDVTPGKLVTGIITEHGICRAPYEQSLAALFSR